MEYSSIKEADKIRVKIQGKFTFSDHDRFKEIIDLLHDRKPIQIDVSGIEFIDSAGLGMFLLIREEAEKSSVQITLAGAQGQVKKMFDVSKFHTLFKMI